MQQIAVQNIIAGCNVIVAAVAEKWTNIAVIFLSNVTEFFIVY